MNVEHFYNADSIDTKRSARENISAFLFHGLLPNYPDIKFTPLESLELGYVKWSSLPNRL